jgi:integrase
MVYGIDYYSGGKRCREIVGPLLGEARQKLEERRALAKGGDISLTDRKKFTFGQLKDKYEEIEKGEPYFEKSRKYYLDIFQAFFEPKDERGNRIAKKLYKISTLDIEQFKAERKATLTQHGKERSGISVNRELQTLRHILGKAKVWGWIEKNPFLAFIDPNTHKSTIFDEEDNGRIRCLEQDEIRRLLGVSPPHLNYIIKTALYSGLRITDVLNLKWNGVNFNKATLTYYEGKKDKERMKFLNQDMIDLLFEIKQRNNLLKINPENIFLGPVGGPIKCISRAFKTALKKAKITNFHIHDLRHTSASHLLMRGASMKAVQEHLGHASPVMTNRYVHVSEEFQREQIALLNGLCNEGNSGQKTDRNDDLIENEQRAELKASA